MQQLNRYYRHSKISERKTRQIIKYFALDFTAGKTAEVVDMTRASVSHIFVKVRIRIAEQAERASPFGGTVEVDESYFGARRVRGKRGGGASGKTIVFGISKRNGSVYTEKIVPQAGVLRQSKVADYRRKQKVVRMNHARLNIVVAHSLVKLAGDDVFIAHHIFIVYLPKSSAFDAFGNKRVEPNESVRFLTGSLPAIVRLQTQSFKNIGNKNGIAIFARNSYFGSRAD
jgi:transposase-like protein